MKTEYQIKRDTLRLTIDDMEGRFLRFRKNYNLHLNDFCRLMVDLGYYDSWINLSKNIPAMLSGRYSSYMLLQNMYDAIQEIAHKGEKYIKKTLGKRRIGFKNSPIGYSVKAIDRRLTNDGSLGARYVRARLRKANN